MCSLVGFRVAHDELHNHTILRNFVVFGHFRQDKSPICCVLCPLCLVIAPDIFLVN
jgi:hypothetical protein